MMGKLDFTKCLKCQKSEQDCKCEGGYKIIFHLGVPKSKEEMEDTKTFDEALTTAQEEIDNIRRLSKNLGI